MTEFIALVVGILIGLGIRYWDRRSNPKPFSKVTLDVLDGLKGGVITKQHRMGHQMVTTSNGYMLCVVGTRLVSIPDLVLTPEEEKAICDAIAIRLAMQHAADLQILSGSAHPT